MKNDALPTIAHAHLGQADALPRGIKDAKCMYQNFRATFEVKLTPRRSCSALKGRGLLVKKCKGNIGDAFTKSRWPPLEKRLNFILHFLKLVSRSRYRW
jgi:hypothetical protein